MLFSSTAIRWLVQMWGCTLLTGVLFIWISTKQCHDCCRVCVWKESNLCYSRCNSSIIEGHFSTFWEKHVTESTFTPFLRFFCHVPKELPFHNGKSIPPKVRRRIFWRHPILNLYFSFDIHEAFDFRRYFQCDSGALGLFFQWTGGKVIDGGAAGVLEDDSLKILLQNTKIFSENYWLEDEHCEKTWFPFFEDIDSFSVFGFREKKGSPSQLNRWWRC